MPPRLAHIGIAVANLEDAIAAYTNLLGRKPVSIETVSEQKVKLAFFATGEAKIELLEGTDSDSPISKFIARRGPGIHHVSFVVDNIQAELSRLKAAGVRLIDQTPRRGAEGALIAFIHPESAGGILIELQEKRRD